MATIPSTHPLNKYFPIVKKTILKKIKYWVFFKNEKVKINGGRNIREKESLGKTSFQCPTVVARDAENAGTKLG